MLISPLMRACKKLVERKILRIDVFEILGKQLYKDPLCRYAKEN